MEVHTKEWINNYKKQLVKVTTDGVLSSFTIKNDMISSTPINFVSERELIARKELYGLIAHWQGVEIENKHNNNIKISNENHLTWRDDDDDTSENDKILPDNETYYSYSYIKYRTYHFNHISTRTKYETYGPPGRGQLKRKLYCRTRIRQNKFLNNLPDYLKNSY